MTALRLLCVSVIFLITGCSALFEDLDDHRYQGGDVGLDAGDVDVDAGDADADADADAGDADADTDTDTETDADGDSDANGGETGPPSEEYSSITGQTGVDADGSSEAEITIELRDASGNPVNGVTPEFTASGDGNEYGACSPTDDGISTCTMKSTERGEKELQITEPITLVGETIEFGWPCDRDATEEFGGGTGTSNNPFRVCNLDQLDLIRQSLSRDYVLRADLDMGASWEPIGGINNPFTGSFDGDGFVIRNLTIDESEGFEPVGFFRVLGSAAEVKNLVLEDITVAGTDHVGGLAGVSEGGVTGVSITGDVTGFYQVGGLIGLSSGTIADSSASGVVTGVSSEVGGLVGNNGEDGEVRDSHVVDTIVESERNAGGLVGMNRGAIIDSYATGKVTGHHNVGGLVGTNSEEVEDCQAMVDVSQSEEAQYERANIGGLVGLNEAAVLRSSAGGPVTAVYSNVGGLVGQNEEHGTIDGSHSTGDVTSSGGANAGGLVGLNEHSIVNSSATGGLTKGDKDVGGLVGLNGERGNISASFASGSVVGPANIGGFVGTNSGDIEDSYATGSVEGGQAVGGFFGNALQSTSISTSYSSGQVHGDQYVGGFGGVTDQSTQTSHYCYWDTDTSTVGMGIGDGEPDGIAARTTNDFSSADSFDGWNFSATWVIDEAPDGIHRPILQWQE